jgi:hypothetical protein
MKTLFSLFGYDLPFWQMLMLALALRCRVRVRVLLRLGNR